MLATMTSWERKGFEEGKIEMRRSIALNMLKENLPPEQISRLTGLSMTYGRS